MSSLPSLGPRGEGWVVMQLLLLLAGGLAGILAGGGWNGGLAIVTRIGGAMLMTMTRSPKTSR